MRFLFVRNLYVRCEHSTLLRRVWEDFQAWRRGEVRIAAGQRGRIYQRVAELEAQRRRYEAAVEAFETTAPEDAGYLGAVRRNPTARLSIEIIRADGTREPGPPVENVVVIRKD